MCILQELHCRICHASEGGDGKKPTFLFQLCREFQEKLSEVRATGEKQELGTLKLGGRYYCSGLKWPPELNSPGYWVCNNCLVNGYWYYREHADICTKRRLRCTRTRDRRRNHCVKFSGSWLKKPTAHLPMLFQKALESRGQKRIVALYDEDYGFREDPDEEKTCAAIQEELDKMLVSRLHKTDLCSMTISIPYCNLCKQPEIEYTEDADHHDYFPNSEWEPNEALLKWLLAQRSSGVFETAVKTAFIHRPCHTCIERETALRQKVRDFLGKHGGNNCMVWLICNWIFSRGMGNFPMFDHAAFNHGYPDDEPPKVNEILEMMAASWKRATSVSWEDLVELNPPVSCALPAVAHAEPLIDFDQWPNVQPDAPLKVSDTLPSMDLDDSDSSDDGVDEDRAATYALRPMTWRRTLYNLVCLGANEAIMASMQIESGLSPSDFDKAYSALKRVLAGASGRPLRGSIALNLAPTQNIASSSQEERSTSQKPMGGNEAQTRRQDRSLPSSILQTKNSSQSQHRAVKESRAMARADPPSSVAGETRCSTAEVDCLPDTPRDDASSRGLRGDGVQPVKQVRFQDLDSIQLPDDDLFGDTISDMEEDPEPEAQPDGDTDMPDAGSDTPSSEGEEDAWQKCGMGAWHLHKGRRDDEASELVYLPLGISYTR